MKGKIGTATRMTNAKGAGCSFKVPKRDRQWLADLRRAQREARKLNKAWLEGMRAGFDITPRLKK